jgi:hypothetical protein
MLRSLLKVVSPSSAGQARTAADKPTTDVEIDPALTGRVSALETALAWARGMVETKRRELTEAGQALQRATVEQGRAEHAYDDDISDERARTALGRARDFEGAARRAEEKAQQALAAAEAELSSTAAKLEGARLDVRKAELRAQTDLSAFLARAERHAKIIDAAAAIIKEHSEAIDNGFDAANAAADELTRLGERTDRLHIRHRWYPLLALRVAEDPALSTLFVNRPAEYFDSTLSKSFGASFDRLAPKVSRCNPEFTAAALERFDSLKGSRR